MHVCVHIVHVKVPRLVLYFGQAIITTYTYTVSPPQYMQVLFFHTCRRSSFHAVDVTRFESTFKLLLSPDRQ